MRVWLTVCDSFGGLGRFCGIKRKGDRQSGGMMLAKGKLETR